MTVAGINGYEDYDLMKYSHGVGTVGKEAANDEFIKMIVEQMFLKNSFKFVDIDNEEDEEMSHTSKLDNKWMLDYMRENVITELNENDAFGLRDALKERGLADVK